VIGLRLLIKWKANDVYLAEDWSEKSTGGCQIKMSMDAGLGPYVRSALNENTRKNLPKY
jgi:hypothetical protein